MYIYNVTINIDESIQTQWLNWMQEEHIPEMLATGKFSSALMSRVMVDEEMGGITYSVQYKTQSYDLLQAYHKEDAERLRSQSDRFKGKFVAFRTELEVIDEQ